METPIVETVNESNENNKSIEFKYNGKQEFNQLILNIISMNIIKLMEPFPLEWIKRNIINKISESGIPKEYNVLPEVLELSIKKLIFESLDDDKSELNKNQLLVFSNDKTLFNKYCSGLISFLCEFKLNSKINIDENQENKENKENENQENKELIYTKELFKSAMKNIESVIKILIKDNKQEMFKMFIEIIRIFSEANILNDDFDYNKYDWLLSIKTLIAKYGNWNLFLMFHNEFPDIHYDLNMLHCAVIGRSKQIINEILKEINPTASVLRLAWETNQHDLFEGISPIDLLEYKDKRDKVFRDEIDDDKTKKSKRKFIVEKKKEIETLRREISNFYATAIMNNNQKSIEIFEKLEIDDEEKSLSKELMPLANEVVFYSAVLSGEPSLVEKIDERYNIQAIEKHILDRASLLSPNAHEDMIYKIKGDQCEYLARTMNYAINSNSLKMVDYLIERKYIITIANIITALLNSSGVFFASIIERYKTQEKKNIEEFEALKSSKSRKKGGNIKSIKKRKVILPYYLAYYFSPEAMIIDKHKKIKAVIGMFDISFEPSTSEHFKLLKLYRERVLNEVNNLFKNISMLSSNPNDNAKKKNMYHSLNDFDYLSNFCKYLKNPISAKEAYYLAITKILLVEYQEINDNNRRKEILNFLTPLAKRYKESIGILCFHYGFELQINN